MRRDLEQDKTGSAAELEHSTRPEREDRGNCVIEPLAHLLVGNRLAGVTRIPAGGVEGRVPLGALRSVDVVEQRLPMR